MIYSFSPFFFVFVFKNSVLKEGFMVFFAEK